MSERFATEMKKNRNNSDSKLPCVVEEMSRQFDHRHGCEVDTLDCPYINPCMPIALSELANFFALLEIIVPSVFIDLC